MAVTNEFMRVAAVGAQLKEGTASAMRLAVTLGEMDAMMKREEGAAEGLRKLTNITEAVGLARTLGHVVDGFHLAQRVEQPVAAVPEVEDALLLYRALNAATIAAEKYGPNASGDDRDREDRNWQRVIVALSRGLRSLDKDMPASEWAGDLVEILRDKGKGDPIALFPPHLYYNVFSEAGARASLLGPWGRVGAALAAVVTLRTWDWCGVRLPAECIPWTVGARRARWPQGGRHIPHHAALDWSTSRARIYRTKWTDSMRRLSVAAKGLRKDSRIREFVPWAQTHYIFSDRDVMHGLDVSRRTASRCIEFFHDHALLIETTGYQRDRVYATPGLFSIFQGT